MPAPRRSPIPLPDLSVVIIGRNEGERLERCILTAQAIEGWTPKEILYVDSGSTDGSVGLATRLGATVLPLPPGPFTAARARNFGWRHASGEMILFLDGDTILNADFPLAALAKLHEDSTRTQQPGAIAAKPAPASPSTSVFSTLDWVYPPGETLYFGGDVSNPPRNPRTNRRLSTRP